MWVHFFSLQAFPTRFDSWWVRGGEGRSAGTASL